MDLPLLKFLAENGGVVIIVVAVIGAAWHPVMGDNARRPRELYAALFGKGTSDGRGEVPGERPKDRTQIDWEDGERR